MLILGGGVSPIFKFFLSQPWPVSPPIRNLGSLLFVVKNHLVSLLEDLVP